MDNLYTNIPTHLKNFIQGNHTYLNPGIQYLYSWSTSPNGDYTTKAGFCRLLNRRLPLSREHSWNWLWKLPTQENIKMFFWLAFQNSIPTLSTLHHRGIVPSPICRNCLEHEETLIHCIRDCPSVRTIWVALDFGDVSLFHELNVHLWLKQGGTGSHDTLFIACVWWAWKARNARRFNNEIIPFPRLLLSITKLAATFKACFQAENSTNPPTRLISWQQQGREGIILNVDGSSLGNLGLAGFGGLARDPDGD